MSSLVAGIVKVLTTLLNRPEGNSIVEKIAKLCGGERYSGKTMGVVVLQGEAQGGLIEGQLLERLGAEEMARRRLVCGNPYSFQGDERDIMFLSVVAATNERIGPFTRPADERRFNVAASRARDQMYLFHSVRSEDLSTSCLRRRLLDFFENTKPQEIAGIEREELERRAAQDNRAVIKPPAPFESWFEVDVALELVRKGFNVCPQHEVAGKRIDLVVEGGQARLAVECDGDEWHGADRYEANMQRQRQLERCGWEFFTVRESAFYSNKECVLQGLWRALEERGIFPGASGDDQGAELDEDENDTESAEEKNGNDSGVESSIQQPVVINPPLLPETLVDSPHKETAGVQQHTDDVEWADKMGSLKLRRLHRWAKEKGSFPDSEVKSAYWVADSIARKKKVSPTDARKAKRLYERAVNRGFSS